MKRTLFVLILLVFGSAFALAQGDFPSPVSKGPNLKPVPKTGTLPIPQPPSAVNPQTVADFDAAVAALTPVPNDIDLTVDVVGLDIRAGSSEEKQLNEVAAAGAGKYYGVADAAKLAGVFAQVAQGTPAPPAGGAGGGGMVLPKAGLSPLAVGAIALGLLSLALLAGVLVLRNRRAGTPARAPAGGKIRARADIIHPDGRTRVFEIYAPVTSIGRAGDNDIVVDDEQVSGHHAEISAGPEGFRVRDLGSTNGTFLRGQRVSDASLYAGDEVTVGSVRIVLGG